MEFRIKDVNLIAEDDNLMKIGGYINVTERESEMLYSKKRGKWFKEIMKRGVFQRAIDKALEIPLLFEHDWNKKLATTGENTLTLKEDNVGLKFEAVIEDRNVYEQIKSGVINACSFGFRALDEAIEPISTRLEKRLVSGIELLEVSLVKNPAYVGSLAEVRAYEEEIAKEEFESEERSDDENEEKVESEEETEEKDEEKDESEEEETEDESDEESEEERESEEETCKREFGDNVNLINTLAKEDIVQIIDELIEQKLGEVKEAEYVEEISNEQLESAKDFHKEIEKDMEIDCMKNSAEVINLRLQLLKLKMVKDGI